MPDNEYDEEAADRGIREAREIVIAITAAQFGDVNAMANWEAIDLLDPIIDDNQMMYNVVRWFSGLTVGLTRALADEYFGDDADHNRMLQMIRAGMDGLDFTSRPNTE